MKKLKMISKYSIFVLLIVVIYSFIITNLYTYKSKYKGNEKTLKVYVREIKENSLLVKGKEKVVVRFNQNIKVGYNDYILIEGSFEEPKSNTNFNTFNYKKYLNNKKIKYIFNANRIKVLKKNKNIFYRLKNNISNRIENYESKEYLKVFLLGDKSDITKDTKDIYRNLGIIHLLSISGTYISIIILFLNKILKLNNKIMCTFLIFYIVFTNFQISIIRSSICYILFQINKKYSIDIENKNIIVLFASLLLIINPYYLYDIGFLLSFIISYSLVFFNYIYKEKNYIYKALLISILSFISSFPIIVNSYYSVNLLSIIYNIFYVPYASFILFPISFLTYIFPCLDNIFNFLIFLFEKTTNFLNNVHILNFSFSKIPIILVIVYYLLLFCKKKKLLLSLIVLLYFNNYYLFYPRIYFLDVGQGDSALIRIRNKNILIDTGGSYQYDNTDNYLLSLKSIGVKKIDYMFISHGDLDHIGNSLSYIDKIKVENIYINKYKKTTLEKDLCKYKCNMIGDEDIIKISNTNFYILNPKYDMDNENDNSLVINFMLNKRNILFMGDASSIVEERLINDYDLGKIDILKVGHHGSNTSSSKEFIDEIKPKYSVISVGENNSYGHPNIEVLNTLDNSKIYRTDKNGEILFYIKNKIKIKKCK